MRKSFRSIAFFSLIFALLSIFAAAAEKLDIASPKDKVQTKANRLFIRGEAAGAKGVYANSVKLDIGNNGSFEAVSLLHPGKNTLNITAYYSNDLKETKTIRILKIVTFDDMEMMYSGRTHWAKQDVLSLATIGIIEGYPDNTFGPDMPLLRGELATWIARARNLKIYQPKEDPFFDVPKEHWRAPYIKAVVAAGIMKGASQDSFGIDMPVKRDEVAEIISKAYKLPPLKLKKSYFLDVTSKTKYVDYINSAHANGIVVGVPGKERMFEPERAMKRSEAALLFASLKNVKTLRSALFDYSKGYTPDRTCKIGTRPVIKKTTATPDVIAADGVTPLKISADVEDAQGPDYISQVWVDLSSLGGPNNSKMSLVGTGAYEISFVMTTETESGLKNISITALGKEGLASEGKVRFSVTKK